jgi:hypothetical protein
MHPIVKRSNGIQLGIQRAVNLGARATKWAILVGVVLWCAMPWLESAWKMRRPFDLHRNDSAFVHESFRFEYEVGNLLAFPGRTLRLRVDVHYDAMPVLYADRFEFQLPDGEVAIAKGDFWLFEWYTFKNYLPFPVVECSSPTLWRRVIYGDGDALRNLFRFKAEPGYDSLTDFRDLPIRHGTRLTVRLVGFERT